MKRRQRRPVLDLKGQSSSQGEQARCKSLESDNATSGQNAPLNSLANLLCHYNSDSDNEDSKKDSNKLDDQVNNFLKEIQFIAPKDITMSEPSSAALSVNAAMRAAHLNQDANSRWRECIDESTGYPYYWHIETNEVTWEMPHELRVPRNQEKMGNTVQPGTLQEPHWVNFSSMSYQKSQENIPEGMIPREVVVRNRNRFAGNEPVQKQKMEKREQDALNTSDANDEDSDDGRIEMITSYGSEDSDSDTENNQSDNETPNKPTFQSVSKGSNANKACSAAASTKFQSNSKTPARDKHGKHQSKSKLTQRRSPPGESMFNVKSEEEYSKELSSRKGSNKHCSEAEMDFRVSLVPGYEVESENEEEGEHKQRKCLFPIPQSEDAVDTSSFSYRNISNAQNRRTASDDNKADSNDSNTGEKRLTDKEDEDNAEKADQKSSAKPEQDVPKPNKFLEALQEQNKCFQRKRRIAFDVPPAKVKITEDVESSKAKNQQLGDTNNGEIEQDAESQSEVRDEPSKGCDKAIDEASMDSTKSLNKEESSNIDEDSISQQETHADPKDEELNSMSQIIREKLKFLSEGKPEISPVQTMAVQLQTLFTAWEGGYLEKNYLRRWLTETNHELERLEQVAAPPGWLCQWDRSHKRYYYQNATTGATQWTYPDTGIAGGAEEMEICSTPPPAEQEDLVASVEIVDPKKQTTAAKQKKVKEDGTEKIETTPEQRTSEMEAPPPPKISNPSPPPPPKIYAEDLKKDKKKRDKDTAAADVKQLEVPLSSAQAVIQAAMAPQNSVIPTLANTEPLPPGVDIPDVPYEIPATALKRILYNTVQGASLYEAAARDPTVPILGHPIVQEHYLQYPAYHQHLHAPATLVLPHKHGVQAAIQLIPDYTPIYTNHKVIEKPPVKTQKESLVSALDSFYSDIAQIEKSGTEQNTQKPDSTPTEVVPTAPVEEPKSEVEQDQQSIAETVTKEKKKKKTRVGISKKHKEVSSMVAKWQRAQQHLDDNT